MIPHACRNREELGEIGLRRWTFLYMIHKYLRERPELDRDGLQEQEWTMPSYQAEGAEPKTFRYADVQAVGGEIAERIGICRGCQANLDPKADEFGCVGRINYPILACFEEFVHERLQRVIDRRDAEEWPSLLGLILRSDSPFNGQPIARLRATELRSGSRLIALAEPLGFERAGDGMSTDHIFHALLGMASPDTEETGYGREIPRELLSVYLDFLSGLLYAHLTEERVVELSRGCATYLQFRWLHRALRLAYRLDLPLLIH